MKLLRYNDKLKFISLDTETEGLNQRYSRPWSLAWIVVENAKIVKEFDLYPFIHDLILSPDAARITRFDHNEYKSKSSDAMEIYKQFEQYYFNEDYLIVGHNIYYDYAMIKCLERYLKINKKYDINHRIIDTMALSKAYKLGITPPKDKNDYIAWQFSMVSHVEKGLKTNLGAMCKEFGIDFSDNLAHGSLFDIKKTRELFNKLIWSVEI